VADQVIQTSGPAAQDFRQWGLLQKGIAPIRPAHHDSTGIRVTRRMRAMGPTGDVERKNDMSANDLRDKTPDQLREQLTELKKEQFNLRFQQATGQLENPARMRAARREAARVKTVLNEKAASAAE